MELVTFFTTTQTAVQVMDNYASVLGKGDTSTNFAFLDKEIDRVFYGIPPVKNFCSD